MKNKIGYIFTILIIILCSGCTNYNYINQTAENKYITNRMDEIIQCFDNKDVEGLKSMFCDKMQEDIGLSEKIQNAFNFYEGQSTSYDKTRTSYAGGGMDSGEWIDKHFRPLIDNIKTDEDKEYSISYFEYTIYKYDESQIGIVYLNLVDSNGNLLARII